MKRAGIADSEEEAVTYLTRVVGPEVSETKIRAYVRAAAEMAVRILQ